MQIEHVNINKILFEWCHYMNDISFYPLAITKKHFHFLNLEFLFDFT